MCEPQINVPIVWVLGGPGSGKGTQCEKIVLSYGFVHLSTGELLRDEVKKGSSKGKQLQAVMDKGGLVSDDIVMELLYEAVLSNLQVARGFLIDGYPRRKEQGDLFEKMIAPVTCILFFEVSEDTMMKRLKGRARASGRSDDNEDTFAKRIQTFNKEKDMILAQYASKIKKIKADGTIDEIFTEVQKHLDPLVKS